MSATGAPGNSPGAALLDCRDLVVRSAGRTLLDSVSLRIGAGEAYALVGPAGSGKSLLVAVVCGLLKPDGGSVERADVPPGRPGGTWGAALGYVPQDAALYADMSARHNLRFFGSLLGLSGERLRDRVARVLEAVELTGQAGERVDRQPMGFRRRLSLAIGLLGEPDLLVLDDPAAGSDPRSRDVVLGCVSAAVSRGAAVLYATPDAQEAERVCGQTGRVGLLARGRLVAEGRLNDLRARMTGRQRVVLAVLGDERDALGILAGTPGVLSASVRDGRLEATVADAGAALPLLVAALADAGVALERVEAQVPDLESIALYLAGQPRAS